MSKHQILDGKKVSNLIQVDLAEKISKRVDAGHQAPGLAVVLVGNDEASQVYVNNKIVQHNSYLLKKGDLITFDKDIFKLIISNVLKSKI